MKSTQPLLLPVFLSVTVSVKTLAKTSTCVFLVSKLRGSESQYNFLFSFFKRRHIPPCVLLCAERLVLSFHLCLQIRDGSAVKTHKHLCGTYGKCCPFCLPHSRQVAATSVSEVARLSVCSCVCTCIWIWYPLELCGRKWKCLSPKKVSCDMKYVYSNHKHPQVILVFSSCFLFEGFWKSLQKGRLITNTASRFSQSDCATKTSNVNCVGRSPSYLLGTDSLKQWMLCV